MEKGALDTWSPDKNQSTVFATRSIFEIDSIHEKNKIRFLKSIRLLKKFNLSARALIIVGIYILQPLEYLRGGIKYLLVFLCWPTLFIYSDVEVACRCGDGRGWGEGGSLVSETLFFSHDTTAAANATRDQL